MRYICVFCGSSLGQHPRFTNMAQRLGHALAQQGIGLVYGGGNIGLMGVLASTVLQEGGTVIGVMPKHLAEKELLHQELTATHIVNTMHEQKTLMADLSAGFITLPGGFGTLEECCEMVTWAHLQLHHKPCGLLNCFGFFDGLLRFFDHQVQEGFLIQANRALLLEASTPEDLLTLVLSRLEPDVR